jgi:hypothetical protein
MVRSSTVGHTGQREQPNLKVKEAKETPPERKRKNRSKRKRRRKGWEEGTGEETRENILPEGNTYTKK